MIGFYLSQLFDGCLPKHLEHLCINLQEFPNWHLLLLLPHQVRKLFLNIPPCTPSASLGVIHCLSLSGKGYFENELMTVLFGGATYNSQSSMSTSPQEVKGERACGGDIVRHKKPYLYLTLVLQLTDKCAYTFAIPGSYLAISPTYYLWTPYKKMSIHDYWYFESDFVFRGLLLTCHLLWQARH